MNMRLTVLETLCPLQMKRFCVFFALTSHPLSVRVPGCCNMAS